MIRFLRVTLSILAAAAGIKVAVFALFVEQNYSREEASSMAGTVGFLCGVCFILLAATETEETQ